MPTHADEHEQELAWEAWALSRRSRRLKRGKAVIACVFAVLITLVSATGALISPRPSSVTPSNQSVVYTSASAIVDPAFSPDGSRIVFAQNTSGNFEIWEATSQGRQLIKLTHLQGDSLFPRFSPDGKSIAFYHVQGASKAIMIMSADGTGVRVLAQNAADGSFEWSPDGQFVAYDEMNGTVKQVSVVNIESGGITFRTFGSAPSWSKDSHSLVLVAQSNVTASVLAIANLTEGYTHLLNITGAVKFPRFYDNSSTIVFLNFLNDSWGIKIIRVWMNITVLAIASNSDIMSVSPGSFLVQSSVPGIGSESAPFVVPATNNVVFEASAGQNGSCFFKVSPNVQVPMEPSDQFETTPGLETIVAPLTKCNFVGMGNLSLSSDGKQAVFSAIDAESNYAIVVVSNTPQQIKSLQTPYG